MCIRSRALELCGSSLLPLRSSMCVVAVPHTLSSGILGPWLCPPAGALCLPMVAIIQRAGCCHRTEPAAHQTMSSRLGRGTRTPLLWSPLSPALSLSVGGADTRPLRALFPRHTTSVACTPGGPACKFSRWVGHAPYGRPAAVPLCSLSLPWCGVGGCDRGATPSVQPASAPPWWSP